MSTPTPIADAYERSVVDRCAPIVVDLAADIRRLETEHAEMKALLIEALRPCESHQHVDAMKCWMCSGKWLLARTDDKTGSVTP